MNTFIRQKKQQDRQKYRLYTVDKNMYIYNMSQHMVLKGSQSIFELFQNKLVGVRVIAHTLIVCLQWRCLASVQVKQSNV